MLEKQEVDQAKTALKFNDTKMNQSMVATKKGDKISPNKTQGFDPDKSGALLEDDDRVIVSNYV